MAVIQTPIRRVRKALPVLPPVLAQVQVPANVILTQTLLVHKVHLDLPQAPIRAPQSLATLRLTHHAAKEPARVMLLSPSYWGYCESNPIS